MELFCFRMMCSEFSQFDKMTVQSLETTSKFSYLVVKASGDCFFPWGRGCRAVPGKVSGT